MSTHLLEKANMKNNLQQSTMGINFIVQNFNHRLTGIQNWMSLHTYVNNATSLELHSISKICDRFGLKVHLGVRPT